MAYKTVVYYPYTDCLSAYVLSKVKLSELCIQLLEKLRLVSTGVCIIQINLEKVACYSCSVILFLACLMQTISAKCYFLFSEIPVLLLAFLFLLSLKKKVKQDTEFGRTHSNIFLLVKAGPSHFWHYSVLSLIYLSCCSVACDLCLDIWFSILNCVSGCVCSEALLSSFSLMCPRRYMRPVAAGHHRGHVLWEERAGHTQS